jgi:hypothetical protein
MFVSLLDFSDLIRRRVMHACMHALLLPNCHNMGFHLAGLLVFVEGGLVWVWVGATNIAGLAWAFKKKHAWGQEMQLAL